MSRLDTDHSSKRRRVEEMINANEVELFAAEEVAKRCRDKQYELRSLLNKTAAATSSLPREILAEIFLAFQSQGRGLLSDSYDYMNVPREYIITRVCKEWREIALATPRMWCRLDIQLKQSKYKTQKTLMEEWIQRSGKCPLEIRIVARSYFAWEPPTDAFDTIIQSCNRWTTFISNASNSLWTALQRDVQFPLLETLELYRNTDLDLETPLEEWNFRFPPRLKCLDVMGSLREPGLAVTWSALTKLHTNVLLGPRSPKFKEGIPLDVLRSCQSLVDLTCQLKTQIVDPNHIFSPTTICFPFLQSLSVTAMPRTITQFMAMTELPAMTTLEVNPSSHLILPDDPSWTTALVDWAKRSSFKLSSLTISANFLDHDCYIADMIRQLSPSHPIEILYIHSEDNEQFCLSDALLEQLTIKRQESAGNGLPRLSQFNFVGNISFTISAMMAMLNSRKGIVTEELSSDEDEDEHEDDDEDEHEDDDGPGDENEPSIEAEEPPSDSLPVSPQTIMISIDYLNRRWFQKQHPNSMQEFYRAIEEFNTDTRSFHLDWQGCDSDDD